MLEGVTLSLKREKNLCFSINIVSFLFVADKVCGKEEDHEGKRSNRRRDSQISNSSDSQSMIRINVRPRKVTPGSN